MNSVPYKPTVFAGYPTNMVTATIKNESDLYPGGYLKHKKKYPGGYPIYRLRLQITTLV